MSIHTKQTPVTTAATQICVIPAGTSSIYITNAPTSSTTVAIGSTSNVAFSNGSPGKYGGYLLPVGNGIRLSDFIGVPPTTLWAVTTAGTAMVSVFISNEDG